jgi:hypothetical protein
VTHEALVQLAESYCKAINEGAVPVIQSTWEAVQEMQCKEALRLAQAHYTNAMTQGTASQPLDDRELALLHVKVEQEAMTLFRTKAAAAGPEALRKAGEELRASIQERWEKIDVENRKRSTEACEKLAKDLVENVLAAIEKKQAGLTSHVRKPIKQKRTRTHAEIYSFIISRFWIWTR